MSYLFFHWHSSMLFQALTHDNLYFPISKMAPQFGVRNRNMCTAILVICMNIAHGFLLDLNQASIPDFVDVYSGMLNGEKNYRLFHVKPFTVGQIKYSRCILYKPEEGGYNTMDIYVETYVCASKILIIVKQIYMMAGVAAGIKKYLFNGEVCLQATNEDTKCLVRDAIKMSVDMHSGLMHPLILKTIEANGHQRVIYSIAKLYSRHNRSVSNKIRTMYISYVISPLLNIDKFSGYSDSPPSSFNSYSSEIYLNIQERRFMVKLTLGAHANKNIIIKIPSYIDGVFKPENILNDQSNIVNLCADLPKHKDRFTEIDISSTDSNAAELVVLANLRRGCWLYTQYSMVPLYGPRYRFIKVVNKKAKQEIYQEGEQMYVTYVEVFDHVHQGWQYVVVNLRKLDGNNYTNDDYGDIKEVYKRIDDEGNIAYLDLRILCRWPYINMLYNIKIDDGSCHDNDIHDVMMDTAGEHEC